MATIEIFHANALKREKILKLQSDAGAREVPFKICRRAKYASPEQYAPWDKTDACRICTDPVIYDSRDSEGKPHICLPCANYLRQNGMQKELQVVDPCRVSEDDLNDEEEMARMAVSMAQHRGDEFKRPVGKAPSTNSGRGLGPHVSFNPKGVKK